MRWSPEASIEPLGNFWVMLGFWMAVVFILGVGLGLAYFIGTHK
jgi:hypothetical protein